MSSPDDSRPAPSRRREVIGGAAAALVMLTVLLLGLVLRESGGGAGEAAAGTATSAPATAGSSAAPALATPTEEAAPGTPVQVPPSGDAAELPPSLSAVAFDEEAAGEDGVRAQVLSLEGIAGTGEGRGNIAGPALRATVRLVNGTPEPVALDLVVVNLTHGPDGTPAPPLQDASRVPFSGSLAPGESAEGVYVFTVPEDDRDVVTLTVGYRAGAPFLTFTGSAG